MPKSLNKYFALKQSGITLIETMVAVVIFAVLAGALYGGFLTTSKTWMIFENNTAVERELRDVYMFLTRDLREAKGVFVTTKDGAMTMSFTRPQKGIIMYTWSPQGASAKKIIRQDDKGTKVLADHVSLFSAQQVPKLINLEIVVAKKPGFGPEASVRLKGKVALRM